MSPKIQLIVFCLLIACPLFTAFSAPSNQFSLALVQISPVLPIPFLSINPVPTLIPSSSSAKTSFDLVQIEGVYTSQKSNLVWNKENLVTLDAKGNFKIRIPIIGNTTSLTFTSIDLQGDFLESEFQVVKKFEIKIVKPLPQKSIPVKLMPVKLMPVKSMPAAKVSVTQKTIPPLPSKALRYSLGLGTTLQTYNDQLSPIFSQTALTFKASVGIPLSFLDPNRTRWDLLVSSFFTAFTLSQNSPSKVIFFGLNGRIGYTLPKIAEPWSVQLNAGFYFDSMFVSPATFGFQKISGPQFYPTLKRTFRYSHSLLVFFKFSPIMIGDRILALTNRELAAGLVYSFPAHFKKQGQSWLITLDLAEVKLAQDQITAVSRSTTLGLGFAF